MPKKESQDIKDALNACLIDAEILLAIPLDEATMKAAQEFKGNIIKEIGTMESKESNSHACKKP